MGIGKQQHKQAYYVALLWPQSFLKTGVKAIYLIYVIIYIYIYITEDFTMSRSYLSATDQGLKLPTAAWETRRR